MLEGAARTLAPTAVIDAVADALGYSMANVRGEFPREPAQHQTVEAARGAIADLVNGNPNGVVLGPNMATLTLHLADALSAE